MKDVPTDVVLDLVQGLARAPAGTPVRAVAHGSADLARASRWAAARGYDSTTGPGWIEVRSPTIRPGMEPAHTAIPARLWFYSNFNCNLACAYCCVRSTPARAPAALSLDWVATAVTEGLGAGIAEFFITGGEPFLHPELEGIVSICAEGGQTTILTNAMLLRGPRLEVLRRFPRGRVSLQVSLDSGTPGAHDANRGSGTWIRSVEGIRVAQEEGFRVRVAATMDDEDPRQGPELDRFLDHMRIPVADRLVRPLAHRGNADRGVSLAPGGLVPELTLTRNGYYWHPVGADDVDMWIGPPEMGVDIAMRALRERVDAQAQQAEAHFATFPCT